MVCTVGPRRNSYGRRWRLSHRKASPEGVPSLEVLLVSMPFLADGNQLVASLDQIMLGNKGFLTSTKTANTFLLKDASDFLERGLTLLENASIQLPRSVCALLAASTAPVIFAGSSALIDIADVTAHKPIGLILSSCTCLGAVIKTHP